MNGNEYLGTISHIAGRFAPRNTALCWGQVILIADHTSLFSLIGDIYGGDGRVSMGLPDFRGRTAIGAGSTPGLTSRYPGQMGGSPEYSIQLEQDDLPPHTHSASFTADVLNEHLESSRIREDCAGRVRLNSNESDGSRGPYHGYPGRPLTASPWAKPETANAQMAPDLFRDTRVAEATLTTSFGDGEHPVTLHSAGRGRSIGLNTQSPVLVVNFVITVLGEFPPRN